MVVEVVVVEEVEVVVGGVRGDVGGYADSEDGGGVEE